MLEHIKRFTMTACVCAGFATAAQADDLVMPFACTFDRGEPRLTAANDTSYRIVGQRDEQAFSTCASGPGACTMMMIHKFAIDCDGRRVSWARVAAASAPALGLALPRNLPAAYAPVSTFSARFVLPSLARTSPGLASVSTQDLSPDSVIEASYSPRPATAPQWETVVKADFSPEGSGNAVKVAGVLASIMALLTAASLVASGRWRTMQFAAQPIAATAAMAWQQTQQWLGRAAAGASRGFSDSYRAWQAATDGGADDNSLQNGLAIVYARLAETELLVATLPVDLLLRDVLQSEIEGVRERAADLSKRIRRAAPEKSTAALRTLMRELERIGRIAYGASKGPARTDESATFEMPKSVFEAYRMLGLNSDAPATAVKKIVDALRVTWHPDHARDDGDRALREDRMKQINAAWDMIKDRRAAA